MTITTKLGDVAAYLRKGDTFTWNDEQFVFYTNGCGFFSDCVVTNRGTVNLAKEVELLNPRWVTDEETCSKGLAIVGGLRHPTMYATLCRETAGKLEPVRASELPREVASNESPRLVNGSELRVGDRMLFAEGGDVVREEADDWNADGGPFTVVRVDSLSGTRYVESENDEEFVCGASWTVELLSRATESTPALDTDRLRREWEYLAERIRWHDIAAIHLGREWASGFTPEALTTELEAWATDAFERALSNGEAAAHIPGHFLVVLQPNNRDRPIELYSEALAATAYHAKAEELWPTAAMEAEAPKNCVTCDAMCASGQIECGDCRSGRARRFSNLPPSFTRTENRFRGLPPAPSVHLSPGALYHLQDDPDATGIPGGNG